MITAFYTSSASILIKHPLIGRYPTLVVHKSTLWQEIINGKYGPVEPFSYYIWADEDENVIITEIPSSIPTGIPYIKVSKEELDALTEQAPKEAWTIDFSEPDGLGFSDSWDKV